MRNAIILTISGDRFFFEDNNFTYEQLNTLQELVENIPDVRILSVQEICERVIDLAKKELNIDLREIKISFVLRINK